MMCDFPKCERTAEHWDHDHNTGDVRGNLCAKHNFALGGLGDTIEGVLDAVKYLKQPRIPATQITQHYEEGHKGRDVASKLGIPYRLVLESLRLAGVARRRGGGSHSRTCGCGHCPSSCEVVIP